MKFFTNKYKKYLRLYNRYDIMILKIKGKGLIKMNMKNMILNAVALDMVNFDEWDYKHIGGVEYIVHDVEVDSDDLVQVAYPQHEELLKLKEELEDEKLYADEEDLDEFGRSERYYELLDEVEGWLMNEVSDIYDYEGEPVILINGQIQ